HKTTKVKEAALFYTCVFSPMHILMKYESPDRSNLFFAQIKFNDYLFNAMSSKDQLQEHDFTDCNSFVLVFNYQEEIDHYWKHFTDGGKESMCGWVQDRYGVWWQVIPSILKELMSNPDKAQKVVEAFMKMKKFDIETLKNV